MTRVIAVRIPDDLFLMLDSFSKESSFSISECVKLSIYIFFADKKNDEFIDNPSFQEISRLKKQEMIRNMSKIIRKTEKSYTLLPLRIYKDLMLYVVARKSKKDFVRLLKIYSEEAKSYDNKEIHINLCLLIKEFAEMSNSEINDYVRSKKKILTNINTEITYIQKNQDELK